VNAKFPAAVAIGNTETSQRVVDAAFGALAKLLPDRVPAMSQGSMNNVTMGPAFIDADAPWVYYETIGGGAGAGPGGPSLSGRHSHMTNTMNTPVEAFEQAYPIRVTRYAIREKSGGAGRFMGGDGIVREYVFDAPTRVVMQSTRRRVAPKGLNGGGNGQTGRNVRIGSDGAEHELPGQFTLLFEPGERLRIETPGGGGWGAVPS
jgi:N-methylhydantoinase B